MQDTKDVAKELLSLLKKNTEQLEKVENLGFTIKGIEVKDELFQGDFSEMNLSSDLLKQLYLMSYEKPSVVQSIAIPLIQKDVNLAMQSMAGTGKTIAFVAGMLNKLEAEKTTQALIITPTKELNQQITDTVNELGKLLKVRAFSTTSSENFSSGDDLGLNISEAQVIVGSPGSVSNLVRKGVFEIKSIKFLIIDEADYCLSNESMHLQIKRILTSLNKNTQLIYFSASFTDLSKKMIKHLSSSFEKKLVEIFEDNKKPDELKLFNIHSKNNKVNIIQGLVEFLSIGQMIIFCRTKADVDFIMKKLEEDMFTVCSIHGGMDVKDREKAVLDFRKGVKKVLLATDVFSRGMDIPLVNLVINYDLPFVYGSNSPDLETYQHRIGRTGRFGRQGFVIDFINSDSDYSALIEFQKAYGHESKMFTLEALQEAFYEMLD
ncbi:hypothetical protein EDEG_03372 [Edhazardia aedis USNM 41457]|uniref:RNA helicase n=1 Tax=Edhazardia aedis (strain USNM 41457) TaxID=1003232 RepID=J9D2Y7_EDHAE|nr:hypothetical protein EDEG_03372 [Edhazardia aedis USNM 41457]|eukprot:EJW02176.1 hypothetical protein EDEG_03372 [Edhazardia aedis USNM 41457]